MVNRNFYYNNEVEKEAIKESALKYAKEFFRQNLPDIEMFRGLPEYPDYAIDKDIKRTQELEAEHEKTRDSAKDWSTIQEAIFLDQLEQNNWFGERVRTIRPTNHADIMESTDGILMFDDIPVSFDATYTSDARRKIEKIKNTIAKHELSKITYHYDEETGYKGRLEAPRIVLGCSMKNLQDLAELWISAKKTMSESNAKLANHSVQLILLTEALNQFSAYELYAKNNSPELTEVYKGLKLKTKEILEEKIKSMPSLASVDDFDDFSMELMSDVTGILEIKDTEIKENIYQKKQFTGKVIKLPRPGVTGQTKRAA